MFKKIVEPLEGRSLLEELSCRLLVLSFDVSAPFPVHSFGVTGSLPLPTCFAYRDGLDPLKTEFEINPSSLKTSRQILCHSNEKSY